MSSGALFEAESYRDFLKKWLEIESQKGKKINFSFLSRRAGFSSRSFIGEVIEGRRALTAQSLPKFLRGFNLKGTEAKIFECLVALDEPNLDLGFKNPSEIKKELARLKEKASRQQMESSQDGLVKKIGSFNIGHASEVYAALGSPETGASLKEILSRTKLSDSVCINALNLMMTRGVVEQKEGRFIAKVMNLDVFDLGGDEGFHRQFRNAVNGLSLRTEKSLQSNDELFISSALSVNELELPRFKKKLKDLVLEFMDEAQVDDGDRVVKVLLGFYK